MNMFFLSICFFSFYLCLIIILSIYILKFLKKLIFVNEFYDNGVFKFILINKI